MILVLLKKYKMHCFSEIEGNKISGLQVHVKFEIETSILQLCLKN